MIFPARLQVVPTNGKSLFRNKKQGASWSSGKVDFLNFLSFRDFGTLVWVALTKVLLRIYLDWGKIRIPESESTAIVVDVSSGFN